MSKFVLSFGYAAVVIILSFGMNLPLAVSLFGLGLCFVIYQALGEEK